MIPDGTIKGRQNIRRRVKTRENMMDKLRRVMHQTGDGGVKKRYRREKKRGGKIRPSKEKRDITWNKERRRVQKTRRT